MDFLLILFFSLIIIAAVFDAKQGYVPEAILSILILISTTTLLYNISELTYTTVRTDIIFLLSIYILYMLEAIGGADVKILCSFVMVAPVIEKYIIIMQKENVLFLRPLFPYTISVFIFSVMMAQLCGLFLIIINSLTKKHIETNIISYFLYNPKKKYFYLKAMIFFSLISLIWIIFYQNKGFSLIPLAFIIILLKTYKTKIAKDSGRDHILDTISGRAIRIPFIPFFAASLILSLIYRDIFALIFRII